MEELNRIPKLVAAYLRKDINEADQQELDTWINESEANRLWFEKIISEDVLPEKMKQFLSINTNSNLRKTLNSIDSENRFTRRGRLRRMKRYLIAACIVLIAGSAFYFLYRSNSEKDISKNTTLTTNTNYDVKPGTENAILTLADGSTIELDKTKNGTIAEQIGSTITNEGAQLVYAAKSYAASDHETLSYNSLSTGRGGQYQLVLPDGSKVWLNAVSSIRFPTIFLGNERNVEITGEAYFEVAHDAAKPFRVAVNGKKIEVLGTHFNVNAYSDERFTKTTLLEGKVKITQGGSIALLKPGQQAQIFNDNSEHQKIKIINDIDAEEVIAWKNNEFQFHNLDIQSIMRQVQRWYDVDVSYEGKISTETYVAVISKNVSLSELLKLLEMSGGVHFSIQEKRVIVKP